MYQSNQIKKIEKKYREVKYAYYNTSNIFKMNHLIPSFDELVQLYQDFNCDFQECVDYLDAYVNKYIDISDAEFQEVINILRTIANGEQMLP
jgi:hypothetical protein